MPSNIPGYLVPGSTTPLPGGLTLDQFINTLLVGLTGLAGASVRPKWQQQPPKQPDIDTNWLAFGVTVSAVDANAFVGIVSDDPDATSQFQRQESIAIACSFYGPLALSYAGLVRDGLQIQQNLEALRAAQMGYAEVTDALRVPDFVNERWIERYEMTVTLRRQIDRTYPVLPLLSASGTITSETPEGETFEQEWATPEPETP